MKSVEINRVTEGEGRPRFTDLSMHRDESARRLKRRIGWSSQQREGRRGTAQQQGGAGGDKRSDLPGGRRPIAGASGGMQGALIGILVSFTSVDLLTDRTAALPRNIRSSTHPTVVGRGNCVTFAGGLERPAENPRNISNFITTTKGILLRI
jgi:hypothetical protein